MSEAAEKLKPLLATLTADERAEVAEYLLTLDNGNGDGEQEELTDEEWEASVAEECDRRIADLAAGRTKLIPGDEVMKRLKERFG